LKLSAGITIALLAAFLWFGVRANMFAVAHTWDGNTWAIVILSGLLGWVLRNEFGGL
jgi:hypothetical protein